jgi:hypothetical protein
MALGATLSVGLSPTRLSIVPKLLSLSFWVDAARCCFCFEFIGITVIAMLRLMTPYAGLVVAIDGGVQGLHVIGAPHCT